MEYDFLAKRNVVFSLTTESNITAKEVQERGESGERQTNQACIIDVRCENSS